MIKRIKADSRLDKLPKFNYGSQVWVAGSSVRNCLYNEPYHDIDIFDRTKEALDTSDNLHDYACVYYTDGIKSYKKDEIKVQVIYNLYEDIKTCLLSFDFTICQFAYNGLNVFYEENAVLHEMEKKLYLTPYGVSNELVAKTMRRLSKYISYGYSLSNELIEGLISKIREMSDDDVKEAIRILKLFDEENYGKEVMNNAQESDEPPF